MLRSFGSCQGPVQVLCQGQSLQPGGLPQGILKLAVKEMLSGHWNVAVGAYFPLSFLHLREAFGLL